MVAFTTSRPSAALIPVQRLDHLQAPLTWATPSSPFIFRVALTSYKMFLCYLLFLAGLADHFHISDGHVAVLGCVLLHVGIGGCPLSVLFEVVPCGVLYDAGGGDGVPHVIGQ